MELTPIEEELFKTLRSVKLKHGKVIFIAYYQHDELVRIEPEIKVIPSIMVRKPVMGKFE